MTKDLLCVALTSMLLVLFAPASPAQELPAELRQRIDDAVATAYQKAAEGFPCRVKTRGKPRMLRWENVDKCLNEAASRVDWDALIGRFDELKDDARSHSPAAFSAAVEDSLTAHAIPYGRVFDVREESALMPLTNSLLKFLPPDSLESLPVTDKVGTEVGTFAGVYSYERTGGLASANTYRLALFQYKDRNGNVQSSSDKLLLDSFGVPWKDARGQPGFRFPSERILR